jgi:uncharacterized protein
MKKCIYFLIFLIIASSCKFKTNNSEIKIIDKIDLEKFKTNKIFPRVFIIDNYIDLKIDTAIEDGNYIGIFKDRTIAFTGKFKNSKPEGLFHFYYFNGKIRHTQIYENGLENGPFTYWDESGVLDECGELKNDTLEGNHFTWWNYNTLRSKTFYKNGKRAGLDCYYYKNGAVNRISEYKDDKSESMKSFYENGKIEQIGQYKEGFEVGTWKEYYKDGQLKSIKYYSNSIGVKEKRDIRKYVNTIAENNNSFPIGIWLEYDSVGNVITKTYHDDSFKIIKEDEFYSSGKLHFRTFYNGEVPYMCSQHPGHRIKNGSFEEYFSNGQIKTIGYFIDNAKNGEWKTYDNEGKLIQIENFRDDSLINK